MRLRLESEFSCSDHINMSTGRYGYREVELSVTVEETSTHLMVNTWGKVYHSLPPEYDCPYTFLVCAPNGI